MRRSMMIMNYDEVPVGPEIVRFVDNFDTDPDVKVELLSYVHSDSVFEPLDREAVLQEWGDYKLIEFPSGVWAREMTLGLLGHLLVVRNDLIRGQGSVIVAKFGHGAMDKVEDLRVEWLRNTAIQNATNRLIEMLEQAAHGYNVQMVACWVQRVHSGLLEQMPLRKDQPLEELIHDLGLLADCGHFQGKHVLQAFVGPAHAELQAALSEGTLLHEFLFITHEEIIQMRNDRMGVGKKGPAEQDEADATVAKVPEDRVNMDGFKLSPGGIYVPA